MQELVKADKLHVHMNGTENSSKPLIPPLFRFIPMAVFLTAMTIFVIRNGVSAVEMLVEQFSNRLWLTTAAFMGLFLLKSVSFGLPFALLYIGVGSIYPLELALIVNSAGIALNMQAPYFFGRYRGKKYVEGLTGKFPILSKLEEFSQRSAFLVSFMAKFIGKIPHEITNAILGSLHVPYGPYMIGGMLGLLPTMIATTLVGSSLREPGSVRFYFSLGLLILLTVISYVLYQRQVKER